MTERLETLLAERRKADQLITELRKSLAEGGGSGGDATDINGIKFETRVLDNTPAKDLKSIAEKFLKKMESGVTAVIFT